jgi:hypothetical protein
MLNPQIRAVKNAMYKNVGVLDNAHIRGNYSIILQKCNKISL